MGQLRVIGFILVLCCLLSFTVTIIAKDKGLEVSAQGYAVVQDDLAKALDIAVRDAMRKGIEQALGSYIDSQTLVNNFGLLEDSILAKANGYISSYSIENQLIEDGVVTVVLIMVVHEGRLFDDLGALELELLRKGNPRVLVLIPEDDNGKLRPNSIVQRYLNEILVSRGFQIVTDNNSFGATNQELLQKALIGNGVAMETLGRSFEADLLIIGNTSARFFANVHGLYSYRGTVILEIVDLATNRIISSLQTEKPGLDAFQRDAAEKAMKNAGGAIVDPLIEALANRFVIQDTMLTITIDGIDFSDLTEIEKLIERIRLTDNAFIRSFSNERAKIEVLTGLTVLQLAQELTDSFWLDFKLEVVDMSGNSLQLKKL